MKILTPEIKQTLDFITPEETILLTGKKIVEKPLQLKL